MCFLVSQRSALLGITWDFIIKFMKKYLWKKKGAYVLSTPFSVLVLQLQLYKRVSSCCRGIEAPSNITGEILACYPCFKLVAGVLLARNKS